MHMFNIYESIIILWSCILLLDIKIFCSVHEKHEQYANGEIIAMDVLFFSVLIHICHFAGSYNCTYAQATFGNLPYLITND